MESPEDPTLRREYQFKQIITTRETVDTFFFNYEQNNWELNQNQQTNIIKPEETQLEPFEIRSDQIGLIRTRIEMNKKQI